MNFVYSKFFNYRTSGYKWYDYNCEEKGGIVCQEGRIGVATGKFLCHVTLGSKFISHSIPNFSYNMITSVSFSLSDMEVTFKGRKFVIKPSMSGNMTEAQEICKESGLQVFEPRDMDTFNAVYKVAKDARRLDQVWMNIMRTTSKDP